MKCALVCNCLEGKCSEIYNNLSNALEGRFGKGQFRIYNIEEYEDNKLSKRDDFWNDLRFVCFHAKSDVIDLIAKAIRKGIPVILVRDEGDKPSGGLCRTLEPILGTDDQGGSTEKIRKMIYKINEPAEIIGAIRWVNDFYHPIKQKAIARETQRLLDQYERQLQ